MSSAGLAVSAMEYREAGAGARAGLHLVEAEQKPADETAALAQMRLEMDRARERAVAEAERRCKEEADAEREGMMLRFAEALAKFDAERKRYFAGLEQRVVQLSLGVARKILQREAELDPTLLAALVRIALERMEAGTEVRVRVSPKEMERWREMCAEERMSWEVVSDGALEVGDCVVETALGTANFGFEAQLMDVEQTFRHLLAQRPGAA